MKRTFFKSIIFIIILQLLYSCNNSKNNTLNNFQESEENSISDANYIKDLFDELNKNKPDEILPIDYYRNVIMGHKMAEIGNRNFELTGILEINSLIPGLLCFMVNWSVYQGYTYELYTFDNNQKMVGKYFCGTGWLSPYKELIMKNIPGDRFENEWLSIGDINNDTINEILSFSFTGFNTFTIYGYDIYAEKFIKLLEVNYFINYEQPFTPIEVIDNNGEYGFRILEMPDDASDDLVWNVYLWDNKNRKYYLKQNK
jgi:hypothetical protein